MGVSVCLNHYLCQPLSVMKEMFSMLVHKKLTTFFIFPSLFLIPILKAGNVLPLDQMEYNIFTFIYKLYVATYAHFSVLSSQHTKLKAVSIFIFYIFICMDLLPAPMSVFVSHEGQKRTLDPLGLELQTVLSSPVRVLYHIHVI